MRREFFTRHEAKLAAGGITKIRQDLSGALALPLLYDRQKEAGNSSTLLIVKSLEKSLKLNWYNFRTFFHSWLTQPDRLIHDR